MHICLPQRAALDFSDLNLLNIRKKIIENFLHIWEKYLLRHWLNGDDGPVFVTLLTVREDHSGHSITAFDVEDVETMGNKRQGIKRNVGHGQLSCANDGDP